jgi:SNF family Na+-dependent transporter
MVGLISCIFFSVGILFTTNAGNYWVDIMNDFSASINLLVIGVTQILIIAYMFGGRKWYNEIEWMINPSKNGFKKFVYGFLK